MNRLITFFLVTLPLLLACDKPVQKIVIPVPEKPSGQQGNNGNNENNGNNGNGDNGNTTPTTTPAPTETVIVGYAVYWEESSLPDPSLLTHVNYAFAHIKDDFETLDIKKDGRLKLMVALKKKNPKLKVLLSVGGWEAGNFSEMAADEKHRKAFAKNCANAVTKYSLDGIDIDWEYPTSSAAGISSSPEDTKNFTLLMKDLRDALGQDRLLTMASASNAKYVDFKEAIQYMNFVNVMTYDMGDPPQHNSGLYKSSMTYRSCDESVAAHLAAGVPYDKMVLGIPFYGHGDGKAFGDYVDFKDISIDANKYSVRWDATAMVPYVTDAAGKMVLTYDDAKSVGLKVEYVRQKGLAGAMYWNIEADDASFTLGNAVAAKLLPGYVAPPEPEDPTAFLATNAYVQKYLEEVNYPNTNNPDTDQEYNTTLITQYPGGGPGEADIPPTYTISWTADASAGSLKLHVVQGDWSRDYSLDAGTASQDITNLVPGKKYEWTVTSTAGKAVAKGSFTTKGLLHQVYFEPKGRNGRDLGGWKGLNGKTLAFGKLFRGGAISGSRTNDRGKAEMRAQGIKAEVDLREADDVPSQSPLGSDIAFFAPGFDSGYNTMIRDNKPKVKETFCFVVKCLRENKPVYFHCAAGRDRTGTLAVLLEGALGVSESDMAKDYELTYFSPQDWSMSKDDDGNWYYGHVRTTYSYKSIRKTVFKETDSGTYQERIVKYLLQIGVPQKDIDDLRKIMLE
jgi:chitinase